jgi:hypothetical protein
MENLRLISIFQAFGPGFKETAIIAGQVVGNKMKGT